MMGNLEIICIHFGVDYGASQDMVSRHLETGSTKRKVSKETPWHQTQEKIKRMRLLA